MDRLESSVPFGNTKKFNHSFATRIPKLYNNLSRNGILPDNSTIKSYSLYQIIRYRHNIFKSFILGNPELVDFVFDVRKWSFQINEQEFFSFSVGMMDIKDHWNRPISH